MRARLLISVTLIFAVVSTLSSQSKTRVNRKTIQPDLPGTISGASNLDSIPDLVAYELFMRSISGYPSESVFKKAGLTDDQIVTAMNSVQSFESVMSLFDRGARDIKSSRSGTDKLAQLQQKKDEYIEREFNHYLPKVLGADGGSKLRLYINAQVKPKTKKVRTIQTARRHHAPGFGVYVYTNAWQEGENVYGSGTITSHYSDLNQYLVTTTVVSPNGSRWSTSQTGWDFAAVTDTEYLPIMPNDGTFTVESVFEGSDGYLASAFNVETVGPSVSIKTAVAVPPVISGPGTVNIMGEIQFSEGVPAGTEAIVELNETSNLQNVSHQAGQASGNGVEGTSNIRVIRVGGGPGVRAIVWPINVTSTGSNRFPSLPNVVINDVRIESVTPGVSILTEIIPVRLKITATAPSLVGN